MSVVGGFLSEIAD